MYGRGTGLFPEGGASTTRSPTAEVRTVNLTLVYSVYDFAMYRLFPARNKLQDT